MYPAIRLRRNRRTEWSRRLTREHYLTVDDLIWTLFVRDEHEEAHIPSMPGIQRYTLNELEGVMETALRLNIPALALFPHVTQHLKDAEGSEAVNPDNLICRAIRRLKSLSSDVGIIVDAALDPYTNHGHDGIVVNGDVHNDKTVDILCTQSLIQAQAGADMIAPSDMMDGRVGAIRHALDGAGYNDVQILAYSVKYSSAYYGPFREAIGSSSNLGHAVKHSYQMDPSNALEGLREAEADLKEGADIIMIKPGLPYLDMITRIKQRFEVPTFTFQVSGEYAMIQAAALHGWVDGQRVMLESLLAMKRAGADGIFTYAAPQVAEWLLLQNDKRG